jgi:hypothetical protein
MIKRDVSHFHLVLCFFFRHCEYDKHVHDYDTMQINYLAIDELTSFTEWIYLYLTIERVRVPKYLKGVLPAISRTGSNPGNIGHNWVNNRFIKPNPLGNIILKDSRSGMKRIFIPATIDDNPYADEDYKRDLDALPEAERRAKKYADWSAYEGLVFTEFREKPYPGEPPNALHMVEPFEIPAWWPRIVAMDWGHNAMTYIAYGAISPDSRLVQYREQAFRKTKIVDWCAEVKPYIDKENPVDIVICHSANQHRGEPHTILEQVSDALNQPIRLGERDRISGKTLLHEYLRWKPLPIGPTVERKYDHDFAEWILRNRGVKEYKSYLDSFVDREPEKNLPKFIIFNTCQLMKESILACNYEKENKDGKKKEDVAEFDGDDPYDTVRMLLHAADNFFLQSSETQEKLKKQAELLKFLQNTGDQTTFYRNARKLESEEAILPVSHYNHRKGFYGNSYRH